jgi:hypothetical protein
MNPQRCWCDRGVCAAVLAFLVFAMSVAWTPAGTDAPRRFSHGAASSAPVLYNPGPPSAKAILPAGSVLPAPPLQQPLPEKPPGLMDASLAALVGLAALRFPQRHHLGFSDAGQPFPRHVFLHVYRC